MSGAGFVCTWKRPPLCLRCIKECFVFWEEVLNCGFKSDACLRTQRRLSLFSLSPFYFLFLCRLIDLLLPLLTIATKVTSGKESKSKATKPKLHLFFVTGAVCHWLYRLYNLFENTSSDNSVKLTTVKCMCFAATRSWMPEVY